ncbi:porphobilinogen synthase [Candidatus Sumerlaeota bacterium]|nr:porphobilinogen synthase [Candidatus Sumerlaeota bacterium]
MIDFQGESFGHLRSGIIPSGESAPSHASDVFDLPQRMRRLRANPALRAMVRETRLTTDRLVLPLFVCPGRNVRHEIASMPGCAQLSLDLLVEEVRESRDLGIPAVILFGIPETKDERGSEGYSETGIIARALRRLKAEVPEMLLWADVCLCEYTSHGHCGVIKNNDVRNDETVSLLVRQSIVYAQAGADVIAPSDMMDGRVGAIRRALDGVGQQHTPIVSYSAKYASAFYAPFREAAESAPQFGDRRSYQMDPANSDEALREVALDIAEGADVVMVKPALAYLDVIRRVKDEFQVPVAAYNVSGEYAMVQAAARAGWIDYDRVMVETLTSIRRAGADIILSYHAKDFARLAAKQGL